MWYDVLTLKSDKSFTCTF